MEKDLFESTYLDDFNVLFDIYHELTYSKQLIYKRDVFRFSDILKSRKNLMIKLSKAISKVDKNQPTEKQLKTFFTTISALYEDELNKYLNK